MNYGKNYLSVVHQGRLVRWSTGKKRVALVSYTVSHTFLARLGKWSNPNGNFFPRTLPPCLAHLCWKDILKALLLLYKEIYKVSFDCALDISKVLPPYFISIGAGSVDRNIFLLYFAECLPLVSCQASMFVQSLRI